MWNWEKSVRIFFTSLPFKMIIQTYNDCDSHSHAVGVLLIIFDNRCTLLVMLISVRTMSLNIKTSLHSLRHDYFLCKSK